MKIFATILCVLALTAPVFAQDSTFVDRDFTKFELGVNVTTPVMAGDKVAAIPQAMLKQRLIDNLFTLAALQTGFNQANDSTAVTVGFGYEFPKFSFVKFNGNPVNMNMDLIFSRDLSNGFADNQLVGAGLRIDPLPQYNTAVMFRAWWNHMKVAEEWKTEWSFFGGLEYGIL